MGGCPARPTIFAWEAAWIDDTIANLNKYLEQGVAAARRKLRGVDLKFVHTDKEFSRGCCSYMWYQINGPMLNGLSISDASFHPSKLGFDAYTQAVEKDL